MDDFIPALPYSRYRPRDFERAFSPSAPPFLSRFHVYPRGRDAITAVVRMLGLNLDDEVYIDTTSQSPFVSSCVTCSIFNHARPSRILTDKTRLIFIIHEFGFFNPRAETLIQTARERKIPVFEDSAHALSHVAEPREGVDFQLVSLSKSLPTEQGALLAGPTAPGFSGSPWEMDEAKKAGESLQRFAPYWKTLDERRERHFRFYQRQFSNHGTTLDLQAADTAFFYPLKTNRAAELHHALRASGVEWGQANVPDTFLLPCHALLTDADLERIVGLVRPLL